MWAPSQELLIRPLLKLFDKHLAEQWIFELTLALAQRWFTSTYCMWWHSGGSSPSNPKKKGLSKDEDQGGLFYEKYNDDSFSHKAGGGEYPIQTGFLWTNALIVEIASEPRLISQIKLPSHPGSKCR